MATSTQTQTKTKVLTDIRAVVTELKKDVMSVVESGLIDKDKMIKMLRDIRVLVFQMQVIEKMNFKIIDPDENVVYEIVYKKLEKGGAQKISFDYKGGINFAKVLPAGYRFIVELKPSVPPEEIEKHSLYRTLKFHWKLKEEKKIQDGANLKVIKEGNAGGEEFGMNVSHKASDDFMKYIVKEEEKAVERKVLVVEEKDA